MGSVWSTSQSEGEPVILGQLSAIASGLVHVKQRTARRLPFCSSVLKQAGTVDSWLPKASVSVISLDFNNVKVLIIGRLNIHVMNPISHKQLSAPEKTKQGNALSHTANLANSDYLEGKLI